jgi:hypothetical protein
MPKVQCAPAGVMNVAVLGRVVSRWCVAMSLIRQVVLPVRMMECPSFNEEEAGSKHPGRRSVASTSPTLCQLVLV